jgi:hypothetical protein
MGLPTRQGAGVRARSATRAALLLTGILAVVQPVSSQQSHLLVITGSAGSAAHSQQFHDWANKLVSAATTKYGLAPTNVVYLSERNNGSSKAAVEKAFADLVSRSARGDAVLIVLIGHGSSVSGQSRFNLPGPDLTATDYKRLLDALAGRKIGFVNTASASGAFTSVLSSTGRVVVTATRSGMEGNETVFARFFSEAYSGAGADTDKDNKVSLLEAYTFAAREVERWYNEQNRMMTEHATLDDDGDNKGTSKPDGRSGDGLVARGFVLGGVPAAVASNPELRALYEDKKKIEERISALRGMKANMDSAIYEREMEKLLVDLAEKDQRIRQLEVRKK